MLRPRMVRDTIVDLEAVLSTKPVDGTGFESGPGEHIVSISTNGSFVDNVFVRERSDCRPHFVPALLSSPDVPDGRVVVIGFRVLIAHAERVPGVNDVGVLAEICVVGRGVFLTNDPLGLVGCLDLCTDCIAANGGPVLRNQIDRDAGTVDIAVEPVAVTPAVLTTGAAPSCAELQSAVEIMNLS